MKIKMERKQMNDRIYFRANFSTSTTPASSGGQQTDDDDNIFAEIPLQLPANTLDTTRPVKNVEMMLTKLQIPMSCVPVNSIPMTEVWPEFRSSRFQALSKGIIRVWPFWMTDEGVLLPTSAHDSPIFYDGEEMPIAYCILPAQRPVEGSDLFFRYYRDLLEKEEYPFRDIDHLITFINEGLESALIESIKDSAINVIGGSKTTMRIYFKSDDGGLRLIFNNYGSPLIAAPHSSNLTSRRDGIVYGADKSRVMYKVISPTGEITAYGSPDIHRYSIIVNKYIRDLMPCLPWIKIDNRQLLHWPVTNSDHEETFRHPGYMPRWEEANFGDPYFYMLDTYSCPVEFKNDDIHLFKNTQQPLDEILTTSMEYIFPTVDTLSLINISSIVVIFDGVSMTQQNFPINTKNVSNKSASLTTSVPIIEVYYPMWETIQDLTGDLIISKDAFTNAAPILLGPEALRERNLKFKLCYVTHDGMLHPMKILPSRQLSLQVCYSITYY